MMDDDQLSINEMNQSCPSMMFTRKGNFLFIMTMSLALSFYIYFPVLVILYMLMLP